MRQNFFKKLLFCGSFIVFFSGEAMSINKKNQKTFTSLFSSQKAINASEMLFQPKDMVSVNLRDKKRFEKWVNNSPQKITFPLQENWIDKASTERVAPWDKKWHSNELFLREKRFSQTHPYWKKRTDY